VTDELATADWRLMTTPFSVDIWLRGDHHATTRELSGLERQPSSWTDDDVRTMLEGMLLEMYRLKHPDDETRPIALRGLSWIVNPYEEGGVVVAIEIGLGAAIAGPFDIDQRLLETMITRVLAHARQLTSGGPTTVH
jgi:hypothetical protein